MQSREIGGTSDYGNREGGGEGPQERSCGGAARSLNTALTLRYFM